MYNEKFENNEINKFQQIINYLEKIVENNFMITARKEYYTNNIIDFLENIQKPLDRSINLGTIDEKAEELYEEAHQDFKDTTKDIQDLESSINEIDTLTVGQYIKNTFDRTGLLENKINETFDIDVSNSWVGFIMYLNLTLKQNPFYWDKIKEKVGL